MFYSVVIQITISLSDSMETCTVGSAYLFIHYAKGHMLSLHSVMSSQQCRLTSLNNFHQCNNASNNLPRKYIDLNNKYVANHFLRSAECFIYLFNALHSLKYIFTSSLENMTLVAILNLHGIVGLILKTENSVCQKEQFGIRIFSLRQRAAQPIKTSKKIKN